MKVKVNSKETEVAEDSKLADTRNRNRTEQ